jgi:hypothetical protein
MAAPRFLLGGSTLGGGDTLGGQGGLVHEAAAAAAGTSAGAAVAALLLRAAVSGARASSGTAAAALRLRVTASGARATSGSVAASALDVTPPTVSSITASATVVEITASEPLDESSVPGAELFTVKVNGGAVGVSSTSVSGSVITLSLEAPVAPGDGVTVSYAAP